MIPRRTYRLTPTCRPRVALAPRKIAICLYLAALTGAFASPVAAQGYGGNSSGSGYGGSSSGGGMSASGINNAFPGGSSGGSGSGGGSFRPNNSTFGSPLGLNTGPAGLTDPFAQARANPAAQGNAVAGVANQRSALGMQQGMMGGNMGFGQNNQNNQQRNAANRLGTNNNNRRTQTKRVPTVVRVNMEEFMRDLSAAGVRNFTTPELPPTLSPTTIRGAKEVNVAVGNNGVVTLTGTVTNPRAAEVAAALMSLEPGVRRVESRLAVESLNP